MWPDGSAAHAVLVPRCDPRKEDRDVHDAVDAGRAGDPSGSPATGDELALRPAGPPPGAAPRRARRRHAEPRSCAPEVDDRLGRPPPRRHDAASDERRLTDPTTSPNPASPD